MSKFNFSKPFDKVLVRDGNGDSWKISFFERKDKNNKDYPYACMNGDYAECIPYNEETAHLLGTDNPYFSVKDEVTKYIPGEIVEVWDSDKWTDAIYLKFQVTKTFLHLVYDDNKTQFYFQLPNEIRKKGNKK